MKNITKLNSKSYYDVLDKFNIMNTSLFYFIDMENIITIVHLSNKKSTDLKYLHMKKSIRLHINQKLNNLFDNIFGIHI